jgi:very-short-patch-repair endonuclease
MASPIARRLRSHPTDAEKFLWSRLRRGQLGEYKFRRQSPIGPYVVDFVCFPARLVVEVDGGQHATQVEADATRTQWLESEGFKVLRFWNNEVFENTDGVVQTILDVLAR